MEDRGSGHVAPAKTKSPVSLGDAGVFAVPEREIAKGWGAGDQRSNLREGIEEAASGAVVADLREMILVINFT